MTAVGLVLVTWNLLLVSLYTGDMIASQEGASLRALVAQAATMIREDPWVLLQAAQGSILIGVLLGFAASEESDSIQQGARG